MVIALLPVRNSAHHLDRYFACVGNFVDGIVALDDGSTDDTAARLRASPMVRKLLQNPVRDTYAGWDDAGNRQRLLEAAESLRPQWILQLDADEEITGSDARLLVQLLSTPRLSHMAYGFQVFRMLDAEGLTYDKSSLWVNRLFRYAPGMRLATERLHVDPVPKCIHGRRRLRTNIRIRHFASVTAADRTARFEKYRQADPSNQFQNSYQNLLDAPGTVQRWVEHADNITPLSDPKRHANIVRRPHICVGCLFHTVKRLFAPIPTLR